MMSISVGVLGCRVTFLPIQPSWSSVLACERQLSSAGEPTPVVELVTSYITVPK